MHLPRFLLSFCLWFTLVALSHAQPLPRPPVIVEDPKSLIVAVGQEARLTVNVLPGVLKTTYQWQLGGRDVAGATNATLILSNTQFTNAGTYQVLVANGSGQRLSAEAQLAVVGVEDQSVSRGADVRFTISARSLSVGAETTWTHRNRELQRGSGFSLLLTNVTVEGHAGLYRIDVRTEFGTATLAARLDIDPAFTKITSAAMVSEEFGASGASWVDHDVDGWLDLVIGDETVGSVRNGLTRIFRNNGDGTFSQRLGAPFNTLLNNGQAPIWGDYDNDGQPDLFISDPDGQSWLYHNHGGGFVRRVPLSVLNITGDARGAAWIDYDVDGQLDLFVPFAQGSSVRLYRNTLVNGTNTFVRQTGLPFDTERGYFLGSAWADYDNDGRPDLFVANRLRAGNLLYRNLGGGRFEKVTTGPVATNRADSVGAAWGDYDNDGFFDLFVTNGDTDQDSDNHLYRNNGDGTFTQITSEVRGTLVSDGGESWDCAWADYDNDGFLDLFVVNAGMNEGPLNGKPRRNFLYRNNGDGTFSRIVTGSLANDRASRSCTWGDYDNDGFLDLFAGNWRFPSYLYRNNGNSNGWLKVKPVGTISNRSAIGARVKVLATIRGRTMWQMREVNGGNGYRSQNGLLPHFGLGDATNIQTLRIEWPSGLAQETRDVRPRQSLTIEEPALRVTAFPEDTAVDPGTPVALTLGVGSLRDAEVQWFRDNQPIPGATNMVFEIPATRPQDVGSYRAEVRAEGWRFQTRPVAVRLVGVPAIVRHPTDQSVSLGATVTLVVSATGTAPLAVQWFRDGEPVGLSSESRSLVITNVAATDAGRYSAEVSNDRGSVRSFEARLDVDGAFRLVADSPVGQALGGGVSWGDANGDGWIDLYAPQSVLARNRLFLNTTDGTLALDTKLLPTEPQGVLAPQSGTWADADNDGDLDLLVGNGYAASRPQVYYRNDGAAGFGRVVGTGGLGAAGTYGPTWADFDLDGWLDTMSPRGPLYRNRGDGTFLGFQPAPPGLPRLVNGVAWGDYDNDGDPDLMVVADDAGIGGVLYRNEAGGRFTRLPWFGEPSMAEFFGPAGCNWADLDNDGDLDALLTGWESPNRIYINEGAAGFRRLAGDPLATLRFTAALGFAIADYDSDGWLDVYQSAGGSARDVLFRNDGGGRFSRVELGSLTSSPGSYAAAWGDIDNDGFLDLAVGREDRPNLLYRNQGNTNHWLKLKLTGRISNRDAIGAKVRVQATIQGRTFWQLRELNAGSGMEAQDDIRPNFGLGDATNAATVRIEWPSGVVQEFKEVAANQMLTVEEPDIVRPLATSVNLGATVTLRATPGDDAVGVQWSLDGVEIPGATNRTYTIDGARQADAGRYTVRVGTADGGFQQSGARVEVDASFVKVAGAGIIPDPATTTAAAYGPAGGVSWGDYDADGDLDLVRTADAIGSAHTRLYRNNGDGTFAEVTTGPIAVPSDASSGCVWADIDQDGRLDLLVFSASGIARLYRTNESGELVGFFNTGLQTGVYFGAWLDAEGDGLLDLVTGVQSGQGPVLYRGASSTNFVRQAFHPSLENQVGASGYAVADYDDDGDPDILALFFGARPGVLMRNLGAGGFAPVTNALGNLGIEQSRAAAWGDYDNDGLADLYIVNGGLDAIGTNDRLFRNRGGGNLQQVTFTQSGAPGNAGGVGMDCSWADYDNDGFLDLFVVSAGAGGNFLYRNLGNGTFERILSGSLVNDANGTGATWGDYDNDGFLDVFVGNVNFHNLYRNSGNANGWLKVKPVGTRSNRGAIGAKVHLQATIGGRSQWQLREVNGGGGRPSQNGLLPHFGLGDATNVATLRIEWPGGATQVYHDLAPRQTLTIVERFVAIEPAQLGRLNLGDAVTLAGKPDHESDGELLGFQWYLDGRPVPGATNRVLNVASIRFEDVGFYTLEMFVPSSVSGDSGYSVVTRGVELALDKPVAGQIAIVPNFVPNAGVPLTLTPAVSGREPLSFQWQKNGVDLPGQTNRVLAFRPVTGADVGEYRVVVSNALGTDISPIAYVQVDATFEKSAELSDFDALGGSWGDFDNDGDLDLVIADRASGENSIFLNDGKGEFGWDRQEILVSSAALPALSGKVAWADFDDDGWLDLAFGGGPNSTSRPWLYRNRGKPSPWFETVSPETSGDLAARGDGAPTWVDVDNDGQLELFHSPGWDTGDRGRLFGFGPDRVWRERDGGDLTGDTLEGLGAAWSDYDNDGLADVLIGNWWPPGETTAIRRTPVSLYRNTGNGRFSRVDSDGFSGSQGVVGGVWGDYDNDGDMDLFLPTWVGSRSRLLRNNGDGTFANIATAGITPTGDGAFAAAWGDYDNDGFIDLFVARMNHRIVSNDPSRAPTSSNRLYRNRGDGTFAQIQTGNLVIDQAHYNSAVWADFDGDGFLDLFSATRGPNTPDHIYRNGGVRSGNSNAWVIVNLVGKQSNRNGIGAKVRVKARFAGTERWQMREVFGGDGYTGGPPLNAHFGLGQATVIDTLRIEWPSGLVQELHDQPVKRSMTVTEPDLGLLVDLERPNPGDTVSMTAPAFVGASYQWLRNGEDLPRATNNILAIAVFGLANEGLYQVLVKVQGDPVAGTFSGLSRGRLVELGGKPGILVNRFATPSSVSLGAEVRVIVRVTNGTATNDLRFEWLRNGTNLPVSLYPSANANTLVLPAATLADAGEYRVRITNDRGTHTGEPLQLTVDPVFTAIRAGVLVTEVGSSGGLSWGDFDNDGFLDLVAGQVPLAAGGGHRLYRNKGDGDFEKMPSPTTDPQRVGDPEMLPAREGVIWGDYDNDGLLDLFVSNHLGQNWLYHNDGQGRLGLVPGEVHATQPGGTGASWSDVDGDGWLDLLVPAGGRRVELYRNTATNRFVPLANPPTAVNNRFMLGSSWSDFDGDGRPDLAVANWELGPNLLATNAGNGVLTNLVGNPVTSAEDGSARSVGVAWGDYDNDGLPDLFISNGGNGGPNPGGEVNFLYRNRGAAGFERIRSEVAGTPVNDPGEWWDCAWADYDNDGFLDLYVAHGGTSFQGSDPDDKNALYRNLGDGTFARVAMGSHVNDPGSQFCTWGDYDNDGFLDLVVGGHATPLRLYRNNGNTHGWLKVKPLGTISNRSAIGAKVRLLANIGGRSMWQLREVSGGSGFRGQNGLLPHFGLGDATNVQTLRIEWPSGIVQEYADVAPRQALTITEVAITAVASAASVLPGEAVTFRYEGPTNGVTLQWTLNGTNVVGATGAVLEVAASSLADVGEYRVTATLADATSAGGTLTVTSRPVRFNLAGKPVVGSLRLAGFVQPSVSVGETIRILATVSGATPFTYQWQFNGVDIPTNANPSAARSALQVTNATVAATGSYRLKVRNASGETVGPALDVTVDPRFTRVLTGDLATSTIETITGNWVDYDNDGWLDLWAVGGWNDGNLRGSTTAQLYRNDGTGRLVLQATNLLSRQSVTIWSGQWTDFDNDGDVDVWQAGHDSVAANLFVNEGAGRFVRRAANRNLVPNARATINGSIGAWVDFDSDGLVDFMASHYAFVGVSTTPDTLLFNQGDGTFSAVTSSPISLLRSSEEGVCFVDLNGDGYPDLFTAESVGDGRSRVWLGDARGGFVPQPDHPLALSGEFSVGQVFADIDNDGDPDLFLLSELHGRLGINEGGGQFRWVLSREIGIATVGHGYSVFADLDNDADLDLLTTQAVAGNPLQIKRSQMFLNDGTGRFEEVLTGTPVSIEPGSAAYQPSAGDFTGDGYPDLFVGGSVNLAPKVYVNRHREVFAEQGKTNHWLVLRLKGLVSNGSGIGARVFVTARVGGREVRQFRQVAGQMQWPNLEVHFGLGDATVADSIRIEWPSGIVQELRDVSVDRSLIIEEEFKGPFLSRPTTLADGASEFSLVGRRGKSYRVEATSDFLHWDPVRTVAITNATRVWLTIPAGGDGAGRFYRAVEE